MDVWLVFDSMLNLRHVKIVYLWIETIVKFSSFIKLHLWLNKNIIVSSFKSSGSIQKKKVDHTAVSHIECSSVILYTWQKQPEQITEI